MLDTKLVLDTVLDIIIVADNTLTIKEVNQSVTTIGYTQKELIGKNFVEFTPDTPIVNESFKIVEADNGIDFDSKRIQIRKKDGSLYHADTSIKKMHNEDGTSEYLIIIHDVEERWAARRDLEVTLDQTKKLQADLESANLELQKRQAATEEQLLQEQKFNLLAKQTDFKKDFAKIVAMLVALSLVLPYAASFIGVPEKVTDSTANISLLILQVLGVISAALFAQQSKNKDGNGDS